VQTPRFWGQASSAGTLFRLFCAIRGLRISWLIVGILCPSLSGHRRWPSSLDLLSNTASLDAVWLEFSCAKRYRAKGFEEPLARRDAEDHGGIPSRSCSELTMCQSV
jgi:hypothetical protein